MRADPIKPSLQVRPHASYDTRANVQIQFSEPISIHVEGVLFWKSSGSVLMPGISFCSEGFELSSGRK